MSDSRSKLLPFRSYRGRDAYAFVSYAHDDSTAVFNILADIYMNLELYEDALQMT